MRRSKEKEFCVQTTFRWRVGHRQTTLFFSSFQFVASSNFVFGVWCCVRDSGQRACFKYAISMHDSYWNIMFLLDSELDSSRNISTATNILQLRLIERKKWASCFQEKERWMNSGLFTVRPLPRGVYFWTKTSQMTSKKVNANEREPFCIYQKNVTETSCRSWRAAKNWYYSWFWFPKSCANLLKFYIVQWILIRKCGEYSRCDYLSPRLNARNKYFTIYCIFVGRIGSQRIL